MRTLTRFPPLPLRASADGLVEDFQHYALRMCAMLLISRRELANALRGRGLSDDTFYGQSHASWIGPSGSYLDLVFPMQEFTGQSALTRGTFYRVANVMGRGGTATRHRDSVQRHWCPVCYANWDDEYSFEPLIWSSALLSRCPTHGAWMRSICPSCHCRQSPQVEYGRRRNCSRCKAPLYTDPLYRPASKFQQWIDERLTRYFKFVSGSEEQLAADALNNFLDITLIADQRVGKGRNHVAVFKKSKPTIRLCLNYCAILGCEVEDLFLRRSSESTISLFASRPPFIDLPLRTRVLHHRMALIEECLLELCRSGEGYLLPYSKVADEFDLAPAVIRKSCKATVESYTEKYALQSGLRMNRLVESTMGLVKAKTDSTTGVKAAAALLDDLIARNPQCEAGLIRRVFESALIVRKYAIRSFMCSEDSDARGDLDGVMENWMSGKVDSPTMEESDLGSA